MKRVTLPAFKALPALAIILAIDATLPLPALGQNQNPYSNPTASALNTVLSWLASHQDPDGSYGPYTQIQAAPAAYALWLNGSSSPNARATFAWLASELDNETSGIWYEADIPGEILYTLAVSGNLGLLAHWPADYSRLLAMRDNAGGFKGFAAPPTYEAVASSVDTAMALWGLINAQEISLHGQKLASSYLLSLQNSDGSFNLTSTITSNEFSALGPEPISITALVTLVLNNASYTRNDSRVSEALNYLTRSASGNFSGHVYAAAIAALAFSKFGMPTETSKAITFILSSQNSDGGFRDKIRSSENSNALDTGWAAIALQLVQPAPLPTGLPVIEIIAAVAVAAVSVLGIFVYYRRRRKSLR